MRHSGIIFLSSILALSTAIGEDWPQFLGPNRNGVSGENGLIDSFPADGPRILWRVPLGVGMSGIVVSKGQALTMYQSDTDQFVVAMNAMNGKRLWETKVGPAYENGQGNGPRATPTVHDDVVYAFSGEGILTAMDFASGKLLWSANAMADLAGKPSEYGMASSPLVVDDIVVVHTGAPKGAVSAYDCKTGKWKWSAGAGSAGYSSSVLMNVGGRRQIVALTGASVMGIDPSAGTVLWQFPYKTDYDCNTANPIALDEQSILISAGENHGATILKVTGSGEKYTATPVWTSLGKESLLRAEWQTPTLADGHIFAMDNVGSAGPITNLVCVRLSDHRQMWSKTRFGKSNLTLADGKLFVSTMAGELVILKASTSEYQELARAEVLGMTRQAPTIANGLLLLRDDREVVCVDVQRP